MNEQCWCFVLTNHHKISLSQMVLEKPRAKMFEWQTMGVPYLNSEQNVQSLEYILLLSIHHMQIISEANFKTFCILLMKYFENIKMS